MSLKAITAVESGIEKVRRASLTKIARGLGVPVPVARLIRDYITRLDLNLGDLKALANEIEPGDLAKS